MPRPTSPASSGAIFSAPRSEPGSPEAKKDSMSKIVLVTGAGRGIGAAIARAAGKAGYRVVVNYSRSRDAAEGVVRDIVSSGGEAIAVQGDVAAEPDVERLFRTVDEKYGPLDA